jgi:hypothetical protein
MPAIYGRRGMSVNVVYGLVVACGGLVLLAAGVTLCRAGFQGL